MSVSTTLRRTGTTGVAPRLLTMLVAASLALTVITPEAVAQPAAGDEPEPPPNARKATWMGDLKDHIGHMPLNQLALPATHDSATDRFDLRLGLSPESHGIGEAVDRILARVDEIAPYVPVPFLTETVQVSIQLVGVPIVAGWGRAQSRPVHVQLQDGIRGLDLRFCKPPPNESEPRICHGLYGVEASVVFDQIRGFVQAHPDEVVHVDITNIHHSQLNEDEQHQLRAQLLGILRFADGTSMLAPASLTPSATLDEVWAQRGRIILTADEGRPLLAGDTSGLLWSDDTIESSWVAGNDTWQKQHAHAFGLLDGRCGLATDPRPDEDCPATPVDFANISPAITPSGDTIAAGVLQAVKDDLTYEVLGVCMPIALCAVLDLLIDDFGGPGTQATNLEELSKLGNHHITDQIEAHVLETGNRPNLNIVAVDFYEQSNVVADMIRLNTPPASTVEIGSPQAPGEVIFLTSQTPVTHRSVTRSYGFGGPHGGIAYRVTPHPSEATAADLILVPGSDAHRHLATFHVTGDDGVYELTSVATNRARVSARPHVQRVHLDNTPPVIDVTAPVASQYTASSTLVLDYDVHDGDGSGVASIEPTTLSGMTQVGGHGLDSGQAIDLLTALPLGHHTFTVGGAADNLGNARAAAVTSFEIIVTPQSILEAVDIFVDRGEIRGQGLPTSLRSQLEAAARSWEAGRCRPATNGYAAFQRHVAAQSGKAITPRAAGILHDNAAYLIDHCGDRSS